MKTNYNLPNITATLIPYRERFDLGRCPIFPRGEHPDTRTNKEWLIKMGFVKDPRITNKRYPKDIKKGYPNRKRLMCIDTGEIFEGIRLAEAKLGISNSNLGKHLKGDDQYRHVKGLRFKFI
jgi:hypothetical protein